MPSALAAAPVHAANAAATAPASVPERLAAREALVRATLFASHSELRPPLEHPQWWTKRKTCHATPVLSCGGAGLASPRKQLARTTSYVGCMTRRVCPRVPRGRHHSRLAGNRGGRYVLPVVAVATADSAVLRTNEALKSMNFRLPHERVYRFERAATRVEKHVAARKRTHAHRAPVFCCMDFTLSLVCRIHRATTPRQGPTVGALRARPAKSTPTPAAVVVLAGGWRLQNHAHATSPARAYARAYYAAATAAAVTSSAAVSFTASASAATFATKSMDATARQ